MTDTPVPDPGQAVAGPVPRKLVVRASAAVGRPVTNAARLQVEGWLPYWWVGVVVAVAQIPLAGALGVVVVVLATVGIARLATRNRAPGFPTYTVLAVSDDWVYAMKLSRSKVQHLGAWPRAEVAGLLRRKRITWAITLDRPGLPPARLELLYYLFRARPQAFIAAITAPPIAAPPVAP
jgi:hypothetical protein